jgi:glycosyltransferase involved in cell wall biosynthesis
MRIVHVVGSAQLKSGGPIEGIRQRAMILKQMGHSVDIVTLDAPDAPDLDQLGLPVHAMGPTKSTFGYCPRLKPWLEAHYKDYDVFIVNGLWQYHGIAVHQVAKKHKLPYFVFCHGMLDPWFNTTYPLKKLKKMVYWPWQHAVLRDARAVLFTTEEEKILARESFKPYKVVERVVPYGTATPPPASEHQSTAFFELVPNVKGKKIILSLGRLHPKKGLDLLIEAFYLVFGSDPRWVLVAAGPDEEGSKEKLQGLAAGLGIANRVFWPGMLRGDAKWGAFRAAEGFLLPSHQENFGISVAEALGCGTPAFISNKVNIWREVVAEGAGVAAPDTIDGTVELLRKLAAMTPSELSDMGQRAEACFAKHFEASRMATGLLEVIEELGKPS